MKRIVSASTGNGNELKKMATKLRNAIKNEFDGTSPCKSGKTTQKGYSLFYFGATPMDEIVKEFTGPDNKRITSNLDEFVLEFAKQNNIVIEVEKDLDSWNFEVLQITILHDPADFEKYYNAVNKISRFVRTNFPELQKVRWRPAYADHHEWYWDGDHELVERAMPAIEQFGREIGVEFDLWEYTPTKYNKSNGLGVRINKPEPKLLRADQ